MWLLGDWIHQRLEGVLVQPVAHVLFWIGKQMQRHLALNSTLYNLLPSSSAANMQNNHEVLFEWPDAEPATVVVTGTFDQWSSSIHLTKGSNGFKGSTQIPWNEKIAYKFIVDGQWSIAPSQPTETDPSGNVNNIYIAPSKPSLPTMDSTSPATLEPIVKATEKPAANGDAFASDKHETEQVTSEGVSQAVSDLAIAPKQSVVGGDEGKPEDTTTEAPAPEPVSKAVSEPTTEPAAAEPTPVIPETPATLSEPTTEPASKLAPPPFIEPALSAPTVVETVPAEEHAELPPKATSEPILEAKSVSEPTSTVLAGAPIVPIAIVPVNAAENNESPPPSVGTKKEASTHSPFSFTPTPAPPVPVEPAVVAGAIPSASVQPPTAVPESTPAPAEAVAATEPVPEPVAPASSDVIQDLKSTSQTNYDVSEKPTNGPAPQEDKASPQPEPVKPLPSPPSTPKKKEAFPLTESPSSSPSSPSKFGTPGPARKKRNSIFGKINIKHLFSPGKDKDKEKK